MEALDKELRAIAETQHGLVTIEQVRSLGGNDSAASHRTARGEWERGGKGVLRLVGAPRTWRQRLLGAVLAAGPGAVASHQSAARLHGFPGFSTGPIVLSKPERLSSRTPGARVHRTHVLPDHHLTVIEGVPATRGARTVFDCLRGLHPGRAGRVLDNALVLRRCTLGTFAAVVAEVGGRGVSGTKTARFLLEERGDGYVPPESELEALVLAILRRAGLPAPRRQVWAGRDYAVTGRVDFAYVEAGIVIEADSRRHHSSFSDAANDRWRDNELTVQGWRVLRVTWWQLKRRPQEFVALVRAALSSFSERNLHL